MKAIRAVIKGHITCNNCNSQVCLMGPTGPLVVVIYSQNNKFVTGLKIKATGGSNFNLSPDYHFIYPGKMNDQLQEKNQ